MTARTLLPHPRRSAQPRPRRTRSRTKSKTKRRRRRPRHQLPRSAPPRPRRSKPRIRTNKMSQLPPLPLRSVADLPRRKSRKKTTTKRSPLLQRRLEPAAVPRRLLSTPTLATRKLPSPRRLEARRPQSRTLIPSLKSVSILRLKCFQITQRKLPSLRKLHRRGMSSRGIIIVLVTNVIKGPQEGRRCRRVSLPHV
jgi:hypothetical protein